jgi:hypothetical protein
MPYGKKSPLVKKVYASKKKKTKKNEKEKMKKKLSTKQRKIARMAPPFNKITGADFKKLRMKKSKRYGK